MGQDNSRHTEKLMNQHHPCKRTFVSLDTPTAARNGAGFYPSQGVYHEPADGSAKTAFIATHYNVDFSEHYLGE